MVGNIMPHHVAVAKRGSASKYNPGRSLSTASSLDLFALQRQELAHLLNVRKEEVTDEAWTMQDNQALRESLCASQVGPSMKHRLAVVPWRMSSRATSAVSLRVV